MSGLATSRVADGRVAGSFRDPSGYVFARDGRIFRAIDEQCSLVLSGPNGTGLLEKLVAESLVVRTRVRDGRRLAGNSRRRASRLRQVPRTRATLADYVSLRVVGFDAGRRRSAHHRPATSAAGGRLCAEGRHGLQHPVRPRPSDVHRPLLDRTPAAVGPLVRVGPVQPDVPVSVAAVPPLRVGLAVVLSGELGRARRGAGGRRVRQAATAPPGVAVGRDVAGGC